MEIIGFIVMLLIGIALLVVGVCTFVVGTIFGGNKGSDLLAVIILLCLACWILIWAFINSPFTVTMR